MFKSITTTLFVTVALPMLAQSTFQNLDFEAAQLIPIPGDPFNSVQLSAALPGWTAYAGTNQLGAALHNSLFLSTAGIAIWGPDYPSPNHFEGNYLVVLQAGGNPFGAAGDIVPAAIAQTGTIPLGTSSLRFYARIGELHVTFNGQAISLTRLGGSPPTYRIYGGDVLPFAGQTGELRFTGSAYLDYIQFSPLPIPEPRVMALLVLGGFSLLHQMRRRRRA